MKIALIGASGMVGSAVLHEALSRGHSVTGICRDITRLPENPGLTPLPLDLFDGAALEQAVGGHDAVVSCYSSGHVHDPSRNGYRETIEAVVRIIAAARIACARLLFVGGAGSLVDEHGVALIDQPGYPQAAMRLMHPAFLRWLASLPAMAYDPDAAPLGGAYIGGPDYVPALVRAKLFLLHDRSFDWSFFSPPPAMVPGGHSGDFTTGGDRLPMVDNLYATITTGSAAVAIVDELERPQRTWQHWTAYAES